MKAASNHLRHCIMWFVCLTAFALLLNHALALVGEPRITKITPRATTWQSCTVDNAPAICPVVPLRVTIQRAGGTQAQSTHSLTLGAGFVEQIKQEYKEQAFVVFEALMRALHGLKKSSSGDKQLAAERAWRAMAEGGAIEYTRKADDVILSPEIAARINELGARYFNSVGKTLFITSGSRSPREQAAAMIKKLKLGSNIMRLYVDKHSAGEVRDAYRQATGQGLRGDALLDAVTQVIEAQVARGTYLSNHLRAGAVDVRIRTMNARERRVFRTLCGQSHGVRVLEEQRPPHWHLEFR